MLHGSQKQVFFESLQIRVVQNGVGLHNKFATLRVITINPWRAQNLESRQFLVALKKPLFQMIDAVEPGVDQGRMDAL